MHVSSASLSARARTLLEGGASVHSAARLLAEELSLPLDVVERAVADAFASFTGAKPSTTPVPHAPAGKRGFDLLVREKAGATRLDPLATLSESERARLSPADLASIDAVLRELEQAVSARALPYVPVFGYLSLRNRNADVFGKPQDAVRPGEDMVDASLPGWDVGVVLSTLYRGSPEHPGAVAGLAEKPGAHTPGAVLKLPLARANEQLGRLFLREMVGESDLKDRDARTSNGMYVPRVLDVTLADGTSVPALVFVTNPDGAKNPTRSLAGDELSVGQLAYFMLGEGGFQSGGVQYGGASLDYWEKSYLHLKESLDEPVNPTIAASVEVAKLVKHQQASDALLRTWLDGAFVPLDTRRFQKDG